jgi:Protein of unknown function (DUF1353)
MAGSTIGALTRRIRGDGWVLLADDWLVCDWIDGGAVMATDTTIPELARGSGGFLTGSTVDVRQLDDKFWVTLQPLVYQGKTQRFVIPKGHRTDFASVPRPFVWFLPGMGATPRPRCCTTICGARPCRPVCWRVRTRTGSSVGRCGS